MPPASMKASVTSLATTTSRNGPNGTGAGRPKRSTKSWAATRLSFEWTMVWFSLTAMDVDTTTPAREVSTEQGAFRRRSRSGRSRARASRDVRLRVFEDRDSRNGTGRVLPRDWGDTAARLRETPSMTRSSASGTIAVVTRSTTVSISLQRTQKDEGWRLAVFQALRFTEEQAVCAALAYGH